MPQQSWRHAVTAIVLLLLTACVPPSLQSGPARVSTDEFSTTIDIEGPSLVINPFIGIMQDYNLVTHVDKKTHTYVHVVETMVRYDADPINFQSASDDTAQPLRVIRLQRTASHVCKDCDRVEYFNIVVADEALRAHAATGYRIKVSSRLSQSVILTITPAMIATQFDSLNRVLHPAVAPAMVPGAPAGAAPAQMQPATAPPGLGISYMKVMFSNEVMIVRVTPGSRAEMAGLRPKDILVRYGGRPITAEQDVKTAVDGTPPGSVVQIEILRDRQPMTVGVQM
jgi:hypothetical protein